MGGYITRLFVSNRKFTLGLRIALCERLQLLDRVRLEHRHCKLDIRFRILVPGLFLLFFFSHPNSQPKENITYNFATCMGRMQDVLT